MEFTLANMNMEAIRALSVQQQQQQQQQQAIQQQTLQQQQAVNMEIAPAGAGTAMVIPPPRPPQSRGKHPRPDENLWSTITAARFVRFRWKVSSDPTKPNRECFFGAKGDGRLMFEAGAGPRGTWILRQLADGDIVISCISHPRRFLRMLENGIVQLNGGGLGKWARWILRDVNSGVQIKTLQDIDAGFPADASLKTRTIRMESKANQGMALGKLLGTDSCALPQGVKFEEMKSSFQTSFEMEIVVNPPQVRRLSNRTDGGSEKNERQQKKLKRIEDRKEKKKERMEEKEKRKQIRKENKCERKCEKQKRRENQIPIAAFSHLDLNAIASGATAATMRIAATSPTSVPSPTSPIGNTSPTSSPPSSGFVFKKPISPSSARIEQPQPQPQPQQQPPAASPLSTVHSLCSPFSSPILSPTSSFSSTSSSSFSSFSSLSSSSTSSAFSSPSSSVTLQPPPKE